MTYILYIYDNMENYLMIINEHYPGCLVAEWRFYTFVEGVARVISSELRFPHKSLVGTRSLVLGSEVLEDLEDSKPKNPFPLLLNRPVSNNINTCRSFSIRWYFCIRMRSFPLILN